VVTGSVGLIAVVACLTTTGPDLVMNGPTPANVAGTLSGICGLAFCIIAYRIASRGRRRRVHLLAIPLVLLILQFVIVPAFDIGLISHAPKPAVASAATLGYPGARDVIFSTPDGVRLAAWYVPGTNHAAVILMHGSHGTRTSEVPYLRFLADAGYSVLAVDARGHGESGGETNALGWYGDRDVAGAYRYLSRQPGIDPHRIAGLGLSMGAEELLRATAEGIPLAAVVADGAGASTSGDLALEPRGADGPVFHAVTWLTYQGVQARTGEHEPPGLASIISNRIAPTLLIASHAPNELLLNARYRHAARGQATVWYLADVDHTGGYAAHPESYRSRVTQFLADAMNVG
jgi:dienelactone hydrolase